MEVNPRHDVVLGIQALLRAQDTARATDLAELLYETALLTSGFQLESPKDYASKVYTLIKVALGGESGALGGGAASAGGAPPSVTPEVVTDNPWGK
jgi:heat shock protein beta